MTYTTHIENVLAAPNTLKMQDVVISNTTDGGVNIRFKEDRKQNADTVMEILKMYPVQKSLSHGKPLIFVAPFQL